jgi:hypothetical protein
MLTKSNTFRSPVLRAIASRGMVGFMQAVLIGDMHPAGVPVADNPLTWNWWTLTFQAAEYQAMVDALPTDQPASGSW